MVDIEILYMPEVDKTVRVELTLREVSTVADALMVSGLQEQYPEIANRPVGIFSKQVSKDEKLNTGDRIEIYRALQIDPKDKRRERAKKKV